MAISGQFPRRHLFLNDTFFPSHEENLMASEGDIQSARKVFLKEQPSNLKFLLETRYGWMNEYVDGLKDVIEVGSGPGFAKEFIRNNKFLTSDVKKYDWIDLEIDALNTGLEPESMDAIISSHMIHHVAKPVEFFAEMHRILRPGGYIIISEINTSLMMRVLLWLMKHEGWSYDVDVFSKETVANDPEDPWSANCAIPEMLFSSSRLFESKVPGFKVLKNQVCECLLFPLSGGVIAKRKTLNLPYPVLKLINSIDSVLVALMPSVFALGRRVVLQKPINS